MTGTVNAGRVVYEVDMDTAKLISARREVDAALNGMSGNMGRLETSVNRTERSVNSMERSMSSLTGVAKGLLAALSVQQVTEYANSWVTVSNKLVNSIRANEDLAIVTQRVFDISQDTRSSLDATATLYGRLERSTRSAGTSQADLIKLTETINKGLTVSGATTEEASSTMTQLSQALASGVLRGEEFNSISENGSRLALALSNSLGVTIGELRGMAAQGKLTTEVVVNGLLSQGDAIAKEFSNTTLTMGQSFTVATNNITKFVGESSSVISTLNVFNQAVIGISENLDVVAGLVAAAAAIYGGRFVGALAAATTAQATNIKSTIQGIAATRTRAKEELAAASVTARKAAADKSAALSALQFAEAEYQVARGSAAEAFALENVIRLRAIYVQTAAGSALANNALAASQAKVTTTGITMANALTALKTVTAPLGGPIGVIAIIAAGWYLYAQNQAEAKKESIAFADTLPDVIKRLKEMNLVQVQGARADTLASIKNQKEAIADLAGEISGLSGRYKQALKVANDSTTYQWMRNDAIKEAADLEIQLTQKIRDKDLAERKLADTQQASHQINIQLNQAIVDQMRAARDNAIAIAEAEKKASFLGGTQIFLAEKLGLSTKALKDFNSESLKINWGGTDGEKLIKQAERRLALSKLEGEAKAKQQAAYDADDAGMVDPLAIERAKYLYAETERQTQALKDQKKENKDAISEAGKLAGQQESVAQKLANLKQQAELAASSTQELSREQSILRAGQSLGKGATEPQIQEARSYAAAIWDTAAAIKARNAIPELKESADYTAQKSQLEMLKGATDANGKLLISQEQYNTASERLEQEHQGRLAQIRVGQAVTAQQQSAGLVDPVQQLANENARKMALIQQFEADKTITEQQGLALRNAANQQFEQQRIAAQWEIWRQQSTGNEAAAAAFDSFAGNASNAFTGILTGSMSASDAMRSLGSTVLNSVINTFVQMGVEQARAAIMGASVQQAAIATTTAAQIGGVAATTAASTAAAGTTLAAWLPAALVASVGSFGAAAIIGGGALVAAFALSSALGRKNGGPVSAGNLYEFGEGNLPEMLQMGGKNYMLPGNNGRVFSNKDSTGAPTIPKASTGLERMHQASESSSKSNTSQNASAIVNIVIENNGTPQQIVSQSTEKGLTGQDVIHIITQDASEKGPILQSIMANTSATPRIR